MVYASYPAVVAVSSKSSVLAFILVCVLGPFGYLYVSIPWALASAVVYALLFVLTLGIASAAFPVFNVLLAVVGVLMVRRQNQALVRRLQVPVRVG